MCVCVCPALWFLTKCLKSSSAVAGTLLGRKFTHEWFENGKNEVQVIQHLTFKGKGRLWFLVEVRLVLNECNWFQLQANWS